MTSANREFFERTSDAVGRNFAAVLKALPHLGLLRKRQSLEELKQRALLIMWQEARLVLKREFDSSNKHMAEAMVTKFVDSMHDDALLEKFDPDLGSIEGWLYGVMRKLALQCFRLRSKERIDFACHMATLAEKEPSPVDTAAKRELLERVRQWTKELPPAQRDSLARRFEVLNDLDSGGEIPNRYVALHRGLKRLRERASEAGHNRRREHKRRVGNYRDTSPEEDPR
jgi:hypothetical protein